MHKIKVMRTTGIKIFILLTFLLISCGRWVNDSQDDSGPNEGPITEIRNPDGTVTLTWHTSAPGCGKVEYDTLSGNYHHFARSFDPYTTDHSITLIGLMENQTYYYQAVTTDGTGHPFFTSPEDSFQTTSITPPPTFRAVFIDVRQGDANHIETPAGKRILIDGGYGTHEPPWGQGEGEDWDGNGEPITLNFLQNEGVNHLDLIVETHHHSDHYGGLLDVMEAGIPYSQYLSPDSPGHYSRGDTLWVGDPNVTVKILSLDYPPDVSHQGENNRSIVLKFTFGQADFLFTGDAENEVNDFLFQIYSQELSCEFLKVNHHGSGNGTSENYLNAVNPLVAVISSGAGNPYGHPHQETLNLLQAQGIEIWRTDQKGTITIITDGERTWEISY